MQNKKVQCKKENNDLKKIRIKHCMCYYFDDIIELEDFGIDNILIDEKSHENIVIYDISYKTLIESKPLRIRLKKIDGFIRTHDGIRYLTLFGSEKNDVFKNKIRYLTTLKSGITYIFSSYFAKH